jgi:hypothetical protein
MENYKFKNQEFENFEAALLAFNQDISSLNLPFEAEHKILGPCQLIDIQAANKHLFVTLQFDLVTKKYSLPWTSSGLGALVVMETENSLPISLRISAHIVPLPVPDGPDITYNFPRLRLIFTPHYLLSTNECHLLYHNQQTICILLSGHFVTQLWYDLSCTKDQCKET